MAYVVSFSDGYATRIAGPYRPNGASISFLRPTEVHWGIELVGGDGAGPSPSELMILLPQLKAASIPGLVFAPLAPPTHDLLRLVFAIESLRHLTLSSEGLSVTAAFQTEELEWPLQMMANVDLETIELRGQLLGRGQSAAMMQELGPVQALSITASDIDDDAIVRILDSQADIRALRVFGGLGGVHALSDRVVHRIVGLARLRSISLGDMPGLSDETIGRLLRNSCLSKLAISRCSGVTDAAIVQIAESDAIGSVRLEDMNSISDAAVHALLLKRGQGLELSISGRAFGGDARELDFGESGLRSLRLEDCEVPIWLIDALSKAPQLRALELPWNSTIDDSAADRLVRMPLENIDVSGSRVSSVGAESLISIGTLRSLDLSDCPGINAQCLRKLGLTRIQRLGLANNAGLGGDMMEYLRAAAELRYVDLTNCLGVSQVQVQELRRVRRDMDIIR